MGDGDCCNGGAEAEEGLRAWIKEARTRRAWAARRSSRRGSLPPPGILAGAFEALDEDEQREAIALLRAQPHGATRTLVAALGCGPQVPSLARLTRESWAERRPRRWVNAADHFAVEAMLAGRGVEAAGLVNHAIGVTDCNEGPPTSKVEVLDRLDEIAPVLARDEQLADCALQAVHAWDPAHDRSVGAPVVVGLLAAAGCDDMLEPVRERTIRLVSNLVEEREVPLETVLPPFVSITLARHARTEAAKELAAVLAEARTYLAA